MIRRSFRRPDALILSGMVASLALVCALASPAAAASKPLAVKGKAEAKAAVPAGDAAAGRQLFAARCSVCHGADAKGGVMAPALAKVVGAKAANVAFPRYSAALKASGLTWTPANLDLFLTAPGKLVPGTAMMTALSNPTDRTNVIAYLASLNGASSANDRR